MAVAKTALGDGHGLLGKLKEPVPIGRLRLPRPPVIGIRASVECAASGHCDVARVQGVDERRVVVELDALEAREHHREIVARGLPYLVAERSGRVLGYCYASLYRIRSAYRFTLEDSIYIDAAEVGRGIGRALLSAVIERSSELGYRQMVAVIGGSDQWPSIRLHEALGFTRAGLLTAVGFKFGSWIDTVLMQRALGPGAARPPVESGSPSKGDEHD